MTGLLLASSALAQGELVAEPEEVSFGAIAAGEQRSLPLSIRNIGLDPVALTDAWLLYEDGAVAEPFSVDPGSCETVDALEAGAACEMTANFMAPQQRGSFEALVVVEGDGVEPAVARLSGRSVPRPPPATLVADSALIDFPRTRIGSTSRARQIRVRNSGIGPITLPPAAVTNPHFRIVGNDCPSALTAGAACTISVVFKPTGGPPLPIGYLVGGVTQRGALAFGDRDPATNRFALAVALSGDAAPRLAVGKIKADLATVADSVPRALRGGPQYAPLAAFRAPEEGALSVRVYGWIGKRRVLIANGSEDFFEKERHRLQVSSTRQGRKMLRQPKRTRVRVALTFRAADGVAVKRERTLKVKAPKAKRPAKAKRKKR